MEQNRDELAVIRNTWGLISITGKICIYLSAVKMVVKVLPCSDSPVAAMGLGRVQKSSLVKIQIVSLLLMVAI